MDRLMPAGQDRPALDEINIPYVIWENVTLIDWWSFAESVIEHDSDFLTDERVQQANRLLVASEST